MMESVSSYAHMGTLPNDGYVIATLIVVAPHATIVVPQRRAPRYDSIHTFRMFAIFGTGAFVSFIVLGRLGW
jgi:hypothetical protein